MPLVFPALLLDKGLVQTKVMLRIASHGIFGKQKQCLQSQSCWQDLFKCCVFSTDKKAFKELLSGNQSYICTGRLERVEEQPWTLACNHTCCCVVSTSFVRRLAAVEELSPKQQVDWEVMLSANSSNTKSPFWGLRTWLGWLEPSCVSWPWGQRAASLLVC